MATLLYLFSTEEIEDACLKNNFKSNRFWSWTDHLDWSSGHADSWHLVLLKEKSSDRIVFSPNSVHWWILLCPWIPVFTSIKSGSVQTRWVISNKCSNGILLRFSSILTSFVLTGLYHFFRNLCLNIVLILHFRLTSGFTYINLER